MHGAARPKGGRQAVKWWFAGLAGVAIAVWLGLGRDPRRELERHVSPVREVLREPEPALGERIERWRIVTASGDTLHGLWRGAPPSDRPPWTIVLLGGIGTDDRAALVVPPEVPAHVLAMSWPWSGPRSMSTAGFLARVPAIREALIHSPATLVAGVEAAARFAGGERIALFGASLGVPPALAATGLTGIPRAVILLDGGADLGHLLRHEIRRQRIPGPLADPAAALAAWLLAPLEPRRHAPSLANRRVLLLNARDEERLPAGSVERIHALFPHATVAWREGAHVRAGREGAIARIVEQSLEWLEGTPPGR